MMPGEIRCPTCGRMTPIGPSCALCGAELHEGAARPRGLDREELEERIRMRRGGESPFHRGSSDRQSADETWDAGEFVPEPSDALARQERPSADEPPRVDHLADASSSASGWSTPAPAEQPAPARAQPPAPAPPPLTRQTPVTARDVTPAQPPEAPPAHDAADRFASEDRFPSASGEDPGYGGGRYGDDGYGGYEGDADYGYRPDDGGGGGSGRTGVLAVAGFVILGVAALLGGFIFFGVLSSGPGTAAASPTPTAVITPAATVEPPPTGSAEVSSPPTVGESGGAIPTETPSAVPPDFSAAVQPCATGDMGFKGCAQDGSTISGSEIWIWVGWKNGRSTDVVGVEIADQATGTSGQQALELSKISGCNPDHCPDGYISMKFADLSPGDYDIRVTLNDQQVATSAFSVTP